MVLKRYLFLLLYLFSMLSKENMPVLSDKQARTSCLWPLRHFQCLACIPPALRFFNLVCKLRAKPMPPVPNGFIAYVHATLMQKVLLISDRKWELNIHHHRKADDLGTGFEGTKWAKLSHRQGLEPGPFQLKVVLVWQSLPERSSILVTSIASVTWPRMQPAS